MRRGKKESIFMRRNLNRTQSLAKYRVFKHRTCDVYRVYYIPPHFKGEQAFLFYTLCNEIQETNVLN